MTACLFCSSVSLAILGATADSEAPLISAAYVSLLFNPGVLSLPGRPTDQSRCSSGTTFRSAGQSFSSCDPVTISTTLHTLLAPGPPGSAAGGSTAPVGEGGGESGGGCRAAGNVLLRPNPALWPRPQTWSRGGMRDSTRDIASALPQLARASLLHPRVCPTLGG